MLDIRLRLWRRIFFLIRLPALLLFLQLGMELIFRRRLAAALKQLLLLRFFQQLIAEIQQSQQCGRAHQQNQNNRNLLQSLLQKQRNKKEP